MDRQESVKPRFCPELAMLADRLDVLDLLCGIADGPEHETAEQASARCERCEHAISCRIFLDVWAINPPQTAKAMRLLAEDDAAICPLSRFLLGLYERKQRERLPAADLAG